MNEFLLIEAASEGGKPKVVGLAYSGGKMNLPGWKFPVVVDLSGMQVPEQIPLLLNHENLTSARVGMISAKVEQNTLTIEGEIIAKGEQADGIVEQAKAGADWQLSIGAEVLNSELVKDKRMVNGQENSGPFFHIQKSVLREVSIVSVAADMSTRMKVAASFNLSSSATDKKPHEVQASGAEQNISQPKEKVDVTTPARNPMIHASGTETQTTKKENDNVGKEKENDAKAESDITQRKTAVPENAQDRKDVQMSPQEPRKDETGNHDGASEDQKAKAEGSALSGVDVALVAIRQERDRVSKIQSICNGEYGEIEKQAISAGWSPEETSQMVLKALRENRPVAGANFTVKRRSHGLLMRKGLEAAMCLRIGIGGDELLAEYGEEAVNKGDELSDISMKQLLVECLGMEGINVPASFGNDTIHAAFSTVSLPGILSNVANKKLLQSYNEQPVIAMQLCNTGDLNDFKENDRFRLTDAGDLQPIGPDGEIKEGGFTEQRATNQLDTYGKKFCLTRKMIINDDLGAFMKVPIAMGNRAARLIDQLFFKRLMSNPAQSDGKQLFSDEHKNILTGATGILAAEGLRLAIKMFLDQVDSDGQPISIEPRFLLVPTGLKHTAIELTKGATLIIAGGDASSGSLPTIRPALNSLVDENLQVVSSPYLSNVNYPNKSEKGWYLFGDPKQTDTFEIGFLKGNRVPKVERGDTDYNTLGLWFRVYFDLGIREQDHRGMVKATGE